MQIDFNSDKPIFLQIAEQIEDAILAQAFEEDSQIPSITEISASYKINPATALKGINLLVNDGIVYKKRGMGMFVAENAREKLREKRRGAFFEEYVSRLIEEAERLNISKEEIGLMIDRGFKK